MAAVHQLLPVLSYGDAIGNATLRTRAVLRNLGFESVIYADVIDRRLAHRARPAAELPSTLGAGDGLIYHLSIGSPLASRVEGTEARRIVVYHNITPASFFRDTNVQVKYWADRGRQDLLRLSSCADVFIADSLFNLDDARRFGVARGVVIPPALDLDRLAPLPATGSSPPILLFVGRAAPNKRHDVLIRALCALRATTSREYRLVMVGSGDDTGAYVASLERLARLLGVASAVSFVVQRVLDDELAAHYRAANALVTASEHEGFCVPVVEAMAFSLPVLAHAAAALPETVGHAGILMRSSDPLTWAAAMERIVTDAPLRSTLIAAGRRRLEDFAQPVFAARLARALEDIGLVA